MAINTRMRVWLETAPAILQRLDVKHVSIVTHSAGTLYTLNTLLQHRSLLDPKAPYVAFLGSYPILVLYPIPQPDEVDKILAPWVPNAHSGATLPTLATRLPVNLLDCCAGLNTFINTKLIPSASWSGGIMSSAAALLSPPANTDVPGVETSTSTTPVERYGFNEETAKLIEKLSSKYQFTESTAGANEELKLCLRKCDDVDWADAADYSGCISKIAAKEAALGDLEPNSAKIRVEACFAGSDIMIAKRGQKYFEQCWQSDGVKGKLDFTTTTFPEADHDSVLVDQKKGALKFVFERIVELSKNRG